MREACFNHNENHSTIYPKNTEQNERPLRTARKLAAVKTENGNINSVDSSRGISSDGNKELDVDEGDGEEEGGKDVERHGVKREGDDRQEDCVDTNARQSFSPSEAESYCKGPETLSALTSTRQLSTKPRSPTSIAIPYSAADVAGGPSLARKRKLSSVGSAPLDDSKIQEREDDLQECRSLLHCCSCIEDHGFDVACPSSRKKVKYGFEDVDEAPEITAEEVTDDDYGGVDEIEFSEDESELAMLEEKYIIDSELHSSRGHRGSMAVNGSRHSLTESDFPELFGNSGDSVPTFTSDVGFLYETTFSSSRRYIDSSTKRVRFEDNARDAELLVQDFGGSDSELQSDVPSDHGALRSSLLTAKPSGGSDTLMQSPVCIDTKTQSDLGSSGSSHVSLVQSTSMSEYDGSELSEGSSSNYDFDDGDTTDEEDPPAHAHIHNPHSKLHRRCSPALSELRSNTKMISARSARRDGPVVGHFVVDPRKAVVVLDNQKLKLFPARLPRTSRSSTDSSDSLTNGYPQSSTQTHGVPARNPLEIFGNTPLDIMLCGVFGSNSGLDTLRGQVIGPPEAFYPFTTITANGAVASNDDDIYDYEHTDEIMMNLHELIDFGDASETDLGKDMSTELADGTFDSHNAELSIDDSVKK